MMVGLDKGSAKDLEDLKADKLEGWMLGDGLRETTGLGEGSAKWQVLMGLGLGLHSSQTSSNSGSHSDSQPGYLSMSHPFWGGQLSGSQ